MKHFLKLKNIKYFLLLVLVMFPMFQHLGSLPIRLWDESRLAVSALEMSQNNNYLVTTFKDAPDMWNTKPPLMIWCQVASIKLFGANETAIRLPSALAALLLCFLLLWFSDRYLKSSWYGFIAVMVLITSSGYIGEHVARTGDYDSLLTLMLTAAGLLLFAYCESKKVKYLYFFFIFLALAVLTKGVAGLLMVPGFGLYVIFSHNFISLLKNKHFYFSLICFLLISFGYYQLRELYNPGYIEAVLENEFGGRFLQSNEGHAGTFWFYLNNLVNERFTPWYMLLPAGILCGFYVKDIRINRLTLFATLSAVSFFIVISMSDTKIFWYDAPLYPYFAILTATIIYFVFDTISTSKTLIQKQKQNVAPYIFIFLLFISPYKTIFNLTNKPKEKPDAVEFYEITNYLKTAEKKHIDLNGKFLVSENIFANNYYYILLMNQNNIDFNYKPVSEVGNNETVIIYENSIKEKLEKKFECELLDSKGIINTYRTHERKP